MHAAQLLCGAGPVSAAMLAARCRAQRHITLHVLTSTPQVAVVVPFRLQLPTPKTAYNDA